MNRGLGRTSFTLTLAVGAASAVACVEDIASDATHRGDDAGHLEVDATVDSPTDVGQDEPSPADASLSDAADASARVACKTVAHVGDSLTAYTEGPLADAYASVSIDARIDAYGGRAILQRLSQDAKTGKQAAQDFVAEGYDGCWVVALGTNDTANAAADTDLSRAGAIDAMMKAIDPNAKATVMWVNTFTTRTDGYWSNDNMMIWNTELVAAQSRWPNLRIFDWAAVAATGAAPFSDGIHHTADGYKVRNAAIATALSKL